MEKDLFDGEIKCGVKMSFNQARFRLNTLYNLFYQLSEQFNQKTRLAQLNPQLSVS